MSCFNLEGDNDWVFLKEQNLFHTWEPLMWTTMPYYADSLKAWYDKHIKIFLTTWNQLRVSLATNGKYKLYTHTRTHVVTVTLACPTSWSDLNWNVVVQVRLRSQLSSARRTWTEKVTLRCCYHGDKAQACAPQPLSATSSPCTTTWSTVWTNTLEKRPGGGAHATSFSLAHVWL